MFRSHRSGASLVAQMVKNLPEMQEIWVQFLVGKIPWRREWLSTPAFLAGKFHGQRSLVGYSPLGCREQLVHTCARAHTHTHTHIYTLEDHLLPVCPGLPRFQPWKLQVQCPENPPESQANQDGSRIYHQEPAMVTKTTQQVPRLSISVMLLENKKERRDLSPYLSHENGVSSSTVRSCG